MVGQPIMKFSPLHEGVLIKRYKRFLADIELANGQIVTAHCANTGPMKGILLVNGRVRVRYSPSPSRKLAWSWEQAEVIDEKGSSCWVGVNTSLANKIVRLAIEEEYLKDKLGTISEIRQEVVYGVDRRSRIDLLLSPDSENNDPRKIFIEVKNTTWVENSIALFPDTITKRGQKHLMELINIMPEYRAVLIPCISRADVKEFLPGDNADKKYGELYRKALKAGIEVIPCCFGFWKDSITWEGIGLPKSI